MKVIMEHLGFAFFYAVVGCGIAGLLWWVIEQM